MRSEFCPFLLHHFPFLTIYGNISYTKRPDQIQQQQTEGGDTSAQQPSYAQLYASGSDKKEQIGKITSTAGCKSGNKYDCIIVPIDTPD